MKNILKLSLAALCILTLAAGCIKETHPNTSYVTIDQAQVPGAIDRFVDAVTTRLAGFPTYGGGTDANDFGYPRFFIAWDSMGQDIVQPNMTNGWFDSYYTIRSLGPTSANSQHAWTLLYKAIKDCNAVLASAGAEPSDAVKPGAGLALFYRAYFYLDLAQMYANKPCYVDGNAEAVPWVDETYVLEDYYDNPRLKNSELYAKIIADLDRAESYLAGVKRSDKFTPDVSCVYGVKARAYLLMGEWAKAREYAKKAQDGYTIMSKAVYTDRDTGFNTPNASWMLALTFKSDNPCIQNNDADSCWGSQMIIEVSESGCGYSANYVGPKRIDYHLFQTIPATDFRKKCWVDFAIDDLASKDAKVAALAEYSDAPDGLYNTGYKISTTKQYVGGMPVKFRPKDGEHADQYKAFTVAVPLMRVEEMYLIEAEAAGMQNEAAGKALLETFAKTRDASYTYGTHTDAYYNESTSLFQNEVWWQRRVELWGEGFGMFDIKRLNKGIIRSYPNTNHPADNRWNSSETPQWMTFCIVRTETNYNKGCEQNPTPIKPTADSDEYTW